MSTTSKLPFLDGWKIELSKIPNYDNFKGEFTEPLDWHLLQLLYKSSFFETRPEIKANLKNVIEQTNRKTGELKVSHNQTYKCGRFYADKSISLIPLSRYVKHTVFKYLGWLDIDMVKGHPSIAIEVGKSVGLDFSEFENYVNNFDDIVKTLSDFYSVPNETPLSKDNIKWLFNSMIYGGGFANWAKGVQEGDESYEPKKLQNETTIHRIVSSFKAECEKIMNRIYKENPSLVKKVGEKKATTYEKKCSVCSYWFQIIENHIVYIVAEHLLNCGILQPKKYGLEYDGLNIPPCKDFDKEKLTDEINTLVKLTTGLNIKFKFKEYDDANVLFDIIEARRNMVIEEEKEDEIDDTTKELSIKDEFQRLCEEFEKTHCKIINKSFFIKQYDDSFKIMTEKQLITSYKHLTFKNTDGKPTNFIEHWLRNNNTIKCYDDVDIYPNKSKCPNNIYNLWEDFAMEKVATYAEHKEGLEFILNHIKILCKNDTEVFNFLMCWLAHIVQKPDEKSIVPTLISNEGAGKSTLIILITLMLGKMKMFETAKPSRDVWGDFNSKMKDCFFVNLNELSQAEMKGSEGVFKALVTDPTITINEKGIAQYVIKSFHRFFITSNKEIPVKTGRRTFIIRCSDELIGKTEHFDKFYSLMEDVNVVKTFYEYLKNFKYNGNDMSCFREMMVNPPRTEYELEIRESNMSIPEKFLKDFTYKNINKENVEMSGKEMFDLFTTWKAGNRITYDATPQKLGVSISFLNLQGVTKGRHTRDGDTKFYNILLLKQHFNIGNTLTGQCLLELPTDDTTDEGTDDDDVELVEV